MPGENVQDELLKETKKLNEKIDKMQDYIQDEFKKVYTLIGNQAKENESAAEKVLQNTTLLGDILVEVNKSVNRVAKDILTEKVYDLDYQKSVESGKLCYRAKEVEGEDGKIKKVRREVGNVSFVMARMMDTMDVLEKFIEKVTPSINTTKVLAADISSNKLDFIMTQLILTKNIVKVHIEMQRIISKGLVDKSKWLWDEIALSGWALTMGVRTDYALDIAYELTRQSKKDNVDGLGTDTIMKNKLSRMIELFEDDMPDKDVLINLRKELFDEKREREERFEKEESKKLK